MPGTVIPTRPQPGDTPHDYQPRVIIKLHEARAAVASIAPTGVPVPERTPQPLDGLRRRFPGVSIEPLIKSVTPARLQAMVRTARRNAGANARPIPDLQTFYTATVPRETNAAAIVSAARELDGVERAYLQAPPTRRPVVNASNDPRAASQGYLDAAPGGIDARYAWTIPGGEGSGMGFVDQEGGWLLTHEDLAGASVTVISGLNREAPQHGTSVLGEVLAQDNTLGCIGIAPLATGRVVSEWRTASNYSISDAIISAAAASHFGDVLLIETQTTDLSLGATFLPVEVSLDVWAAIRVVTWFGIVVVEAGGNGGNDLDAYSHPTDGFILKPGHAQFRDSGAIMVGAGSSAAPHTKLNFSNFGNRINCYAWGENIVTTDGDNTTDYTASFGGTSGASPIIAGAAVLIQGMGNGKNGQRYTPARLREIMSDVRNGTPSATPATDLIGVMPNLRAVVRRENLEPGRSAPGDYPTPRRDVQYAAVIDAGHGGTHEHGRSTASHEEKDINLAIARSTQAHMRGSAMLTREGDYNLTLAERAAIARVAGAPAFVSIHANTGRADRAGPEVWVYGGPSAGTSHASRQLAGEISRELEALDGAPVPVRVGELAVLSPSVHAHGTAACLVEAGSLRHPADRNRLADGRTHDAIGAAVARGVACYLRER